MVPLLDLKKKITYLTIVDEPMSLVVPADRYQGVSVQRYL